MDNRQILVPFLNLALTGRRYDPENYQYHQVAIGIETGDPRSTYTRLITTLKTALLHPIVQNVPLDLRTALSIFRDVRGGLGILNVNLRDWRRQENCVTLGEDTDGRTVLVIRYRPPASEHHAVGRTLRPSLERCGASDVSCRQECRTFGQWARACTTPARSRCPPRGAAGHLADGQSFEYPNLHFVDGLPSRHCRRRT